MGVCGSMESHPAWSVERGQAAWSVHLKQTARSPRGSLAQQGQCRLPVDSGLPPLSTSGGGIRFLLSRSFASVSLVPFHMAVKTSGGEGASHHDVVRL
jgi:hypothetical protein